MHSQKKINSTYLPYFLGCNPNHIYFLFGLIKQPEAAPVDCVHIAQIPTFTMLCETGRWENLPLNERKVSPIYLTYVPKMILVMNIIICFVVVILSQKENVF